MSLPGVPSHEFNPHDDDEAARDWLIARVDESADNTAFIAMPHAHNDEQLDALEAKFIRIYELAKRDRPNLVVKLLHALDGDLSRIVAQVHEHEYDRGECIHCSRSIS